MKNKKIIFVFGIFLLCVLATFVNADGMIFPHPIPDVPYPELSVRYHNVNVTIDNQYSITEIDQVFENHYARDLEGTYIFPLPEEASISKFSMWVDNEELTGEILQKDKAREIYESIVRRAQDPALLEYLGRDMFKARVYPIPANGEKRVSISYSEIITCESGVCKYRYPLEIEKFSSKPLESVLIEVKIKSKVQIKTIYSPTHDISVKRISDYETIVSYEANNVRPEKDFELYYTISEEDVGLNLLTFKEKNKDGFFMLLLAPKQENTAGVIGKDIVFVLDTSGSMSGEKIEQAKKALDFCVNNLNTKDKFSIITFESDVEKFSEKLLSANNENIENATDFIEKISASGGTNIYDALLSSLELFSDSTNPKIIVFLTDGQPTVGVTNVDKILNAVSERNEDSRIFVFGVGYDVNTHLLDKISEQNKGVSEYVKPEEDIEVKVSGFYSKISNPVFSDLRINFGKIKVKDNYPQELPDLFKGSQLLVFGRYTNRGDAKITLTGKIGNDEKTYSYDVNFSEKNSKNDFVPRLWATRKIGFLLDEIRFRGENQELVDEIINLSLTYGIMTPYTSFLVDIDTEVPIPQEAMRDKFSESLTNNLFQAVTGSSAVKSAEVTRDLKDTTQYTETERIKTVGTKTFYFREDFWTDNDYSEKVQTEKIEYGSNEYFTLLSQNADLGKYLSLGKKVKFCIGEKCYEVIDDAEDVYVEEETTSTTIAGTSNDVYTTTTIVQKTSGIDAFIFALFIVCIIVAISLGAIITSRKE